MGVDLIMSIRNILRNPRRTLLTMSAIAFACLLLVFMLSFQLGSYGTMINASVKIQAGHIQILAGDYQENPKIRKTIQNPRTVLEILETAPDIIASTPRAEAFSLVSSNDRSRGILVVGIDPQKEEKVSTIKSLIRKGKFLEEKDFNQALVGSLLARHLKVGVGDELTILGQARDGSIAASIAEIKGIYSSGMDEFDRSAIQVPLTYSQDLFQMGESIHRVVLLCSSLSRVSTTRDYLIRHIHDHGGQRNLRVLSWKELMPGLVQGITMDLASGLIFYLILIIVVAFSILNTFLMALFERTREFGVMLAMGTKPGRLMKLLFMESFFLTLAGALLGTLGGCLITLWFQKHGIEISGASDMLKQYGITGAIYPRLTWLSALTGPLAVILITLTSALYPALKAKKLTPVEAMNHV